MGKEQHDTLREIRILSPTAILGYGFPESSFREGLARKPHVIAVDAGSSDPGPYYLGAGVSFTDQNAVKRDLALILQGAASLAIPVIIGSAGGAGAQPHLEWCKNIIAEIADSEALTFHLATIASEVNKLIVTEALLDGRISTCGGSPDLTKDDILLSTHIVAQIGIEPIIDALKRGANVVLAGRAYDPSVFAALPVMRGFDLGLALHLGKILECAAIACTPGSGSACMLGTLRHDCFDVEPLNPQRRCTIASVSAHSLYEKSDPYLLPGPGGTLDLTGTRFEQVTERRVRVTGSRHVRTPYTVKLEGARRVGYRFVSIAGARDPAFIEQIDTILVAVRERVADNFRNLRATDYRLMFRIYGRDGVLGDLEPLRHLAPHEIGLVIEVVAQAADLAKSICAFARSTLLHFGYPRRVSTAGNLAFPYSPSDFDAGDVYEFSVYHLMGISNPTSLFPVTILSLGTGKED
jgi:hypothetical protein